MPDPQHGKLAADALAHRRTFVQSLDVNNPCGSTDDVVARFTNVANDEPSGFGGVGTVFNVVNDAVRGTQFGLRRRGLYYMTASIDQAADATLLVGITKNNAAVAADPTIGIADADQTLDLVGRVVPLATSGGIKTSALVWVSEPEARAVAAGAILVGGAVLRVILSDDAGGTPAAAEFGDAARCYARVTYIGDVSLPS